LFFKYKRKISFLFSDLIKGNTSNQPSIKNRRETKYTYLILMEKPHRWKMEHLIAENRERNIPLKKPPSYPIFQM